MSRTALEEARLLGIASRCSINGKPLDEALAAEKKASQRPCAKRNIVTIKLPLPPRQVHHNARVHWAVKAKATKAMRELAAQSARDAAYMFLHPVIDANLFHKRHRKRDRDGAIDSFKAYADGWQDGGLYVDDNDVRWGEIEFKRTADEECVVFFVSERKASKGT